MMTTNNKQAEIADIFRMYGNQYRQNNFLSYEQRKVMRHLEICRTAELGGHIEACNHCGFEQNAYNSCRDRHCPKCQTMVKEKWLNDRKAELLPCPYFHNVFTLPHEFNPLILANMQLMPAILFAAVNETLQAFARDPQWRLIGQLGFIAVLHTWNQKLMDHFHLHCVIPAGVLSFDKKKWIGARENYLFKTESLAKEFKKRYLKKLRKEFGKEKLCFPGGTAQFANKKRFEQLLVKAANKKWLAYSKAPFGGPEQVLEYLGRYTHRVAITNNRIQSIDNGSVTFSYRDRSDDNKVKELTLPVDKFIRRFLLHILPNGFMKIRYFGFLAHTNKRKSIPLLRQLIGSSVELPEKIEETVQEMMLRLTGEDISTCPECKKGKMKIIKELPMPALDTS
jgi:predicted Zn-ribbon and HTH transcriptional regulator